MAVDDDEEEEKVPSKNSKSARADKLKKSKIDQPNILKLEDFNMIDAEKKLVDIAPGIPNFALKCISGMYHDFQIQMSLGPHGDTIGSADGVTLQRNLEVNKPSTALKSNSLVVQDIGLMPEHCHI